MNAVLAQSISLEDHITAPMGSAANRPLNDSGCLARARRKTLTLMPRPFRGGVVDRSHAREYGNKMDHLGVRIITMFLPSILGACSTSLVSLSSEMRRSSFARPISI